MKGCLTLDESTLQCLEWGDVSSSSEVLLLILNSLAITPKETMIISSAIISVYVLSYLLKLARRSVK